MAFSAHEIYQLIAPELGRVEEELKGYTRSEIKPIAEIGEYILTAGNPAGCCRRIPSQCDSGPR